MSPPPSPAVLAAPTGDQLAALARQFPEHLIEALDPAQYRVLRRFAPAPAGAPVQYAAFERYIPLERGVFLDVETTGLDPATAQPIAVAVVPFSFDPLGTLAAVHLDEAYEGLEDPGEPIPSEITQLTGITDAMVRGRYFDHAAMERALGPVDQRPLVVAHNARFDRPIAERRFPALAELAWACSRNEVPWATLWPEVTGTSVGGLLQGVRRMFFSAEDAHRARNDCLAMLHCLATPLGPPLGAGRPFHPALRELVRRARTPTVRIEIFRSSYEVKDELKRRGYRGDQWMTRRVWYKDLAPGEVGVPKDEAAWLDAKGCAWTTKQLTARQRWSTRA